MTALGVFLATITVDTLEDLLFLLVGLTTFYVGILIFAGVWFAW